MKVIQGAELRVNGGVPSLLGADRPGASDVVDRGGLGIVGPLAMRSTDRVDRREIEHVEAHPGDIGEDPLNIGERPMLTFGATEGTGKELVPRAEAGFRSVHHYRLAMRGGHGGSQERRGRHQGRAGVIEHKQHAVGRSGGRILQRLRPVQKRRRDPRLGPGRNPPHHRRAGAEFQRDAQTGFGLTANLSLPGKEDVDPGFDLIGVAPNGVDDEGSCVLVVAGRLQGDRPGIGLPRIRHPQCGADEIVAIGMDARRDPHHVSDDALDGVASLLDGRTDHLDDDTGRRLRLVGAPGCRPLWRPVLGSRENMASGGDTLASGRLSVSVSRPTHRLVAHLVTRLGTRFGCGTGPLAPTRSRAAVIHESHLWRPRVAFSRRGESVEVPGHTKID